jgi:hypothetical protein
MGRRSRFHDAWEDADIYLVGVDGIGLMNLTISSDVVELYPEWSPDGSRLVFAAGDADGGGFDLWVMDADGTNRVNITNDPQFLYSDPEWSPDGSLIAVTAWTSGYPDIHLIAPDGTTNSNLTDDDSYLSAEAPSWSADGVWIAHVRQGLNGENDIWVMDRTGEREIQITDLEGNEGAPAFEPTPGAFPETDDWFTFFGDALPETGDSQLPASQFAADIAWLADAGITKGCNPPDNDQYCPDHHVTRGQMAAFLVRALGLTERLDNPFSDDDDSIFEADTEKLAAAGITKGCNPPDNDRFCPDSKVTRGQMAAFLTRALGYVDDGGGNLFIDDDGSTFEGDIDRLGTAGVTKGCNPPDNTRYCPTGYVTRGQMAAFLHRALG